jgi:hypothetical protein
VKNSADWEKLKSFYIPGIRQGFSTDVSAGGGKYNRDTVFQLGLSDAVHRHIQVDLLGVREVFVEAWNELVDRGSGSRRRDRA